MWNRRRFLEAASGLPLLGGLAGSFGWVAGVRGETPAAMSAPDYFRDLGVRPFINASGTYTAMTASLMPPEVMDAINYASKHYVMLEELQLKVGERIAKLVQADAAMVTSGAASALTLGTAAVLTGTDQQKMIALPDLTTMKSEVIIQKSHRFGYDHAVRNCGVRLVEVETRDELERAVNPKTAMMLFYNNNNKEGRIQDEEFVQLGKKHAIPTLQRCRRRRAAGREPVEVHEDGVRPGGVLRRQGHPWPAERRPAARQQGPHRRGSPQRPAERQHGRARDEGEQGRDRRHAGRARALSEEGLRQRAGGFRQARRDDSQQRRGRRRRQGRGLRARSRQSCAARPYLLGGQEPDTCRRGHRDARW